MGDHQWRHDGEAQVTGNREAWKAFAKTLAEKIGADESAAFDGIDAMLTEMGNRPNRPGEVNVTFCRTAVPGDTPG